MIGDCCDKLIEKVFFLYSTLVRVGHTTWYSITMDHHRLYCVFLLISLCNAVNGAAVLALFSSLSFADHSVFRGYVSQLTQRGHSVVVMTPYPGQFQYPDIEGIVELDVGGESAPYWDQFKALITNTDDYFPRQRALNELSLKIAIAQLRSKQVTALLINPNIKFDLVVTEADVPVLYAVAEKYGVPHIAITTSSGRLHQHEAKGNPIYPSFYLDVNTIYHASNMTRWQKLVEFYRLIQTRNEYYYYHMPLCELAGQKILDLKRDLLDVENDIDVLLIANNPMLLGNRPVVPGVAYVDRLHIKQGVLPPNLQTLLDSATKGAVYFSLGALQDSEHLQASILKTLAGAFGELPYTVLWRIGNTTAVDLPNNVVPQPWFPQQEVLAHPNLKVFITNGGPRSLEEAVYYQVPVIGLPTIKPRKNFIKQITKFGAGEILDYYHIDKETLKSTIITVATNETYKKAITKVRDMVIDSAISGPEKAVWWTEYVLKHKGAKHLRSPAVGVTFFQYFMVDYVIYLIIVLLVILYLISLVLRLLLRRLRIRIFGRAESDSKYKIL